ncbi:MAG: tetratricopeptide repeat protein [Desulfobacterales bacterium]|nr:tetratricopeptide repeat protein [Desulfobacterales bacterium]
MSSDQLAINEQLPLFEDKRALLNRGILELRRLNLDEAKKSFVDYKGLYHQGNDVDSEIKLTDFLMKGFADAPDACPEEPAYLCGLWASFEDYAKSLGFEHGNIISGIKSSFFRKALETINRCHLADSPFLSDTVPTGYVYIQAGRYDEAIKALQACTPITPDNAAIYGYLGDAYILRGEPDVARQCYLEACLIDPAGIDWPHMKDTALLELKNQIIKELGLDHSLALEWLPSYAYIRRLFKPKMLKLNKGIKEFVEEYLGLRKAFFKGKTPGLKAKLFFRGIILCDNEPLLKFVKTVSFIDVRRLMKELNPVLFSRYLRYVEGTDQYT